MTATVVIEAGFRFSPSDAIATMTLRNARLRAAIEQDYPGEVLTIALRALARIKELTPTREGPALQHGTHASTGRTREGWVLRASGARSGADSGGATSFTGGSSQYVIENKIARTDLGRRLLEILEYGSRPHAIEAKNGRALRFFKEGEWKFRRRVAHPGTQPYAMVRITRADASVAMGALMRRIAVRAIELWRR